MQNIKLSKKEVEKLNELQDSLSATIERFGRITAAEIELREGREELENKFKQLRSSQQEFAAELQEKYGEGTINLETGEFINSK
jgi:seryl-tRNA synthetase|tara:strand:- start:170 stop:421 length:252 start_codon:yes stop_codon:yes gene_type:complete